MLKTVLLLCCPFLGLVGACAAGSDIDVAPNRAGGPTDASAPGTPGKGGSAEAPPREAEILFPRAAWVAGFDAEVDGELVVDGAGCLRIRDEWGDGTVPLWMRD